MKKIFFLLLIAISFSSCEKDDICSEDTTPRLIIEFYDVANPSITKNISNLKVTVVGEDEAYETFSAKSKIELPLKMLGATTQYKLELNSTDDINRNTDIITVNYQANTVFVSRACGYKTVYNLDTTNGFVVSDADPADAVWIQGFTILNTLIENENETHVKILF